MNHSRLGLGIWWRVHSSTTRFNNIYQLFERPLALSRDPSQVVAGAAKHILESRWITYEAAISGSGRRLVRLQIWLYLGEWQDLAMSGGVDD